MLLVDALREDFVEMGDAVVGQRLDRGTSSYQGMRRIELFNDMNIEQPERTILMPLASEMPTVTLVRVKGMMTGGLNAYFEISENFGSEKVIEDTILHQLKQQYPRSKIVFTGDYIWNDMFGDYFDETQPYPSFNVRDLDTLDDQVRADMLRTTKQGNFTLLIGHVIGVDHAGHTYSSSHSEIERKLRDTEKLIKDII
jgi:GPI ethanolamine phosphate transferase 3 subunit O